MAEEGNQRGPGYGRRRSEVLTTAKRLFNEHGVRGFSMASVASALDVKPASLTYYFRKRDDLIAACLLDTIRQFDELLDAAERARSPASRLRSFLTGYFDLQRRVHDGLESAPICISEIRLMTSTLGPDVAHGLRSAVSRLAAMFEDPSRPWLTGDRSRLIARLLIECIDWSSAWLDLYEPHEYPEVAARLADVLERGFVTPNLVPGTPPFTLGEPTVSSSASREAFLTAATRLINLNSYHSVTIDDIAAELDLTKGAFYHHHDDKQALLLACCRRTLELVREAQTRAAAAATPAERLTAAVVALASHQAEGSRGHLLRLYVLSELSPDERRYLHLEYKCVATRFAATISAGIAGGQVPPIDPFLGAMVLIAMCNSAAYFDTATGKNSVELAMSGYVRPCLTGIFTE